MGNALIKPSKANLVAVQIEPLAVCLEDAARIAGTTRWTVHEAILTGALKAKRAGRSRVVLLPELKNWLGAMTDVEPSVAPSICARHKRRRQRSGSGVPVGD